MGRKAIIARSHRVPGIMEDNIETAMLSGV